MKARILSRAASCGVVLALLSACVDIQPSVVTTPASRASIEAREAKAARLAREGNLVRARAEWQVVRTIDPGNDSAARSIAQLDSEIARRAAERRAAGDAAFAAGRTRDAEREYLRVLALIPGDREAFRRLQEIETRSAIAALNTPIPRPEDVDPVPLRPRATPRPEPAAKGVAKQRPAPAVEAPVTATRTESTPVVPPAPGAPLVAPAPTEQRDAASAQTVVPAVDPPPAVAVAPLIEPPTRPPSLDRATALMEQGDYDGAIRELEKIPADSPFAAEARRKLAHAHTSRAEGYAKYGRFPSALAHLEAAERYDGGNAARRAEIRRLRETLAETNYEQGIRAMSSDLPLSAAYFRKAVDYNPQHTRARIQLQTVERMMKNLKKIDTDETGS